jgi:predicted DNA-binding protein (UPF0251 family)
MPRPRKCRRICRMPEITNFGPQSGNKLEPIIMAVDEYESIRLIDLEGLTQEETAERMNVARTTVQSIYNCARKKLAQCLVNGNPLLIQGGDIELCGSDTFCPHRQTCRRQHSCRDFHHE